MPFCTVGPHSGTLGPLARSCSPFFILWFPLYPVVPCLNYLVLLFESHFGPLMSSLTSYMYVTFFFHSRFLLRPPKRRQVQFYMHLNISIILLIVIVSPFISRNVYLISFSVVAIMTQNKQGSLH